MAHVLICGVTESGKTTMAHLIATQVARKKHRVIVYDPVGTPTAVGKWPESAVIFENEGDLFEYLARDDVYHAHIFIDESADLFNHSKRENLWLLTRGRHFGFVVYLICQRPKMVLPSARNQCAICYCFRLAADDLKEIGKDYGFNDLDNNSLDKGDYLLLRSGSSEYSTGNVFNLLRRK